LTGEVLVMRRCGLLVLFLLTGCGLKPAPFPLPPSEMPDSPGLFSGPTGEAILFRR
jgi:hypothetical protein